MTSTAFRLLARKLFESKDLVDLFQFHENYRIAADELFVLCTELEGKGYLERSNLLVRLTAEGKSYIWENRRLLRASVDGVLPWRDAGEFKDWRAIRAVRSAPHFKWLDKRISLPLAEFSKRFELAASADRQ